MESISPITLRKALDALALPARTIQPRRELHTARTTGAAAWTGLGVTLLAAALGVAWAISVWR